MWQIAAMPSDDLDAYAIKQPAAGLIGLIFTIVLVVWIAAASANLMGMFAQPQTFPLYARLFSLFVGITPVAIMLYIIAWSFTGEELIINMDDRFVIEYRLCGRKTSTLAVIMRRRPESCGNCRSLWLES